MGGTQSTEHPVVDLYMRGALNEQSLKALVEEHKPGVDINGTGRKGEAVITLAAQRGDLRTIRLLTQSNANVNLPSSKLLYSRSPFHLALANKHEPLALHLFTSSDLVRGALYIQDGLGKSPLLIAVQKQLHYLLWVMCVHSHAFTAYPSRVLASNYTQWVDLTFTHYITTMRKALSQAYGELQIPLLFGAFGLPATVHLAADRNNYDYHADTPHKFHGMFPNSTKYVEIDPNVPPLLSASPTVCPQCTSTNCKDNDCVLVCYLARFHQFSEFLQNQHLLIANQSPDQFNPTHHPPKVHQQLQNMVTTELRAFVAATSQSSEKMDNATYNLVNSHLIVPNMVLPPPILLSASLQRSYTCTRSKCVCEKPPQQPGEPLTPQICCIYPPLISIPTYPLSFLNAGGHHKPICQTVPLDREQKTATLTHPVQTIVKSKSNVHSTDIIQMHKAYQSQIRKIYAISEQDQVVKRVDSSPSSPVSTSPATTSPPAQSSKDLHCPGFSVPTEFVLSRYTDTTIKPKVTPSKSLGEKLGGLWSNIRDLASVVTTPIPRYADGTTPKTLDDMEPILFNNIRYHSNCIAVSNRFTLSIVGPKRDLITPMLFTEQPTNTAFSSIYPSHFPQARFYEQTAPILNATYTTTSQLQNPTPIEIKKVVESFQKDRSHYNPLPPTLYPPIATSYVTESADITHSLASVKSRTPFERDYQSTCLCGAHTTTIEPVRLATSTTCLNIDGRSLRITDYSNSLQFREESSKPQLQHSLFAAFTPQTSVIYRPSPMGLSANAAGFDFGLPYHHTYQDICPPLAPSHDLSSQSTNKNQIHDFSGKNHYKTVCSLGTFYSGEGSLKPLMELQDLGSVIISPSHNVSIVIPVPYRSIVLLTSGLQRVLQAKFPHYLLYSQWTHFTTRIASAIGRISQRRHNQRLRYAEINILNIYHADLTKVVKMYKLHYFAQLNIKGRSVDTIQKSESAQQLQLLHQQIDMYETYLSFIEQYLILRTYRLSTSQFTPGANILALLGNVISTAEHDVSFYAATNRDTATLANTSYANRHAGTDGELFTNIRVPTVEAMLTSKHQAGAGILTSLPTPLPVNYNSTLNSPLSPPEHTITLDAAQSRFQIRKRQVEQEYSNAIAAFKEDYPQLAKVPNKSVLTEVHQYYERKRAWDMRNALQPATVPNVPKPPTRPPYPLTQPFSMPEDAMVDDLILICGFIITAFQQHITSAIHSINAMLLTSDRPNLHKIDYHESIAILESIKSQATLLHAWLQIGDIHPHYHSHIHAPALREQSNIPQYHGYETPTAQQIDYTQPLMHSPTSHKFDETLPLVYPATPYGNYDTGYNTYYPTKSLDYDPTDVPPQYEVSDSLQTVPSQLESTHYPYSEPAPDYTNNNNNNNNYPTFTPYNQQPEHKSQLTISQELADEFSVLIPNEYSVMYNLPTAHTYIASQSITPVSSQRPSTLYPTLPTQSQLEQSTTPQQAHLPPQLPQRPHRPSQSQVQDPQPQILAHSGDMTGFFVDADFPMPDSPKQPPTAINTPSSSLDRRSSITESNNYFISLIFEEPAIVLALDDEYIERLAANGEILVFLSTKHPEIWAKFTKDHPHIAAHLDQYQKRSLEIA